MDGFNAVVSSKVRLGFKAAGSCNAVSYTHLDVYKRQSYGTTNFGGDRLLDLNLGWRIFHSLNWKSTQN